MASPLGHSLVSCYFHRPDAAVNALKKPTLGRALFLMVLASSPDLDSFVGPHQWLSTLFHRTISHSFFFALWLGCVVALCEALWKGGPLLKRALLYSAVIATHPLVDFFAVIPPYVGAMPLFWPFSWNTYASPVMVLPSALTYVSNIPAAESLVKTFAGESCLAAPLLVYEGLRFLKARRAAAPGRQPAVSFARIPSTGV